MSITMVRLTFAPSSFFKQEILAGVFVWTVFPALGAGNNWVSEVFADPEDKIGTNLAEGWCLYGAECPVDSSAKDLGALWLLDCISRASGD